MQLWQDVRVFNGVYNVTWAISVPWAHPIWHSYVILLYDLDPTPVGHPAPHKHRSGVTHEFLIFACDPERAEALARYETFAEAANGILLTPPNHGYQFAATSNEAATERLQAVVDAIAAGRLSPDTDFRHLWDERFADGVALVKRAL